MTDRNSVLILVLVEHTLRARTRRRLCASARVLILVLVEHTLRVKKQRNMSIQEFGLNPCFSGTYSQREFIHYAERKFLQVLILVLVEHTLRVGGFLALLRLLLS